MSNSESYDPLRLVKALIAIDDVLIERDPEQQGPVDFWIGVEKARRLFIQDTLIPFRNKMVVKYPLLADLIISDEDMQFIEKRDRLDEVS